MWNEFKNKEIFISGGAGVIGTALVEMLLDAGAKLFVGDLKPCPDEWKGRLIYRQGDLNDLTLAELGDFQPEYFFHLAATFERSEENLSFWEENYHHNLLLSHHLIHLFKNFLTLKKVIFASSYLVYDPIFYLHSEQIAQPNVLNETSSISPRNICGAAKFYHENELSFLEQFFSENFNCISARIFRSYGKGSRDIISRWIRAALNGQDIEVYAVEGKFDYIYAEDVAEGLLRLAQSESKGVFNLGFGEARAVSEILNILKQYFPDLRIDRIEREILFENSVADVSQLVKAVDWKPMHTLEMAIPKIIAYEKRRSVAEYKKLNHVLVTSISKKVPCLEAVKKAVLKIGTDSRVFGADADDTCIGKDFVDTFWHCPLLHEWTVENLTSFCKKNDIQIVFPTRDAELLFFAEHRSTLEKEGIHTMVSSPETVRYCLDKLIFYQTLAQAKFPVILTCLQCEEINVEKVVVKERQGAGSKCLLLNITHEQAKEYAKQLKFPIFQPFIDGREWSVDVYLSRGKKLIGSVARLREKVVDGESQITATKHYPQLEQLCEQAALYLGIEGHAIFQVIEDDKGGFHLIECNPRFGGASTASLKAGLDSFYWFLLEAMGKNIDKTDFRRVKNEVRQIRFPADCVQYF